MRSSAMRLLDRNLAALRLAVSIGTIVIALGAAGSAFAGHGGGGHGGGGGWGGGGGHGWGGGGVSHFSAGHVNATHFAGSRGHWASHAASAHASHNWSRSHGNYSHVTRNNLHATHTAGINSNTKNNGKLNHTNLNHANALATNQGKNLNSHVTPLKHAADGVNTVSPALSGFYDSLSDEQKARFDHIAPHASHRGPPPQRDLTTLNVQAQCDAGMMAWPTDQIDRVVRPDEAQRSKLQALQSAAAQAADTIKAACPTEMPNTPPARIAAVGRRLQAILTGVETMRPALAAFYNSLSDDHKARFNSMGRQLFAQSAGTSSE